VPRARRESRRRRRKLIQTPEGILVNGMLDEDRERRGEDRGEQEAEESGEWRVESGYQRGTERRRRWPKAYFPFTAIASYSYSLNLLLFFQYIFHLKCRP
jgi:hypothetical protein